MFPPSGSIINRNEAGEPIGWDVPATDDFDYCDVHGYSHPDKTCEEIDALLDEDEEDN